MVIWIFVLTQVVKYESHEQSGAITNITQSIEKDIINWQIFSIAGNAGRVKIDY
ncbi:MAG: hypothetical protein NTW78_01300 [Campylobacterales bacterium]|nr:hypothetical protein [Campylobacterales bacterium]